MAQSTFRARLWGALLALLQFSGKAHERLRKAGALKMRMGDDEGGGAYSSADQEEDGADGRKKKKKGFIASLVGSVISYIIGGVLLAALCCCGGVASWFGLIKGAPAYVGAWEKYAEVKDGKEEDAMLEHKLTIRADNTGTYTDKDNKASTFKWTADGETKLELEMDGAGTLWKDSLKGKVVCIWAVNDAKLTLRPLPTAVDEMTFEKAVEAKSGGDGKRRKRR